jgi:hypothetical protein
MRALPLVSIVILGGLVGCSSEPPVPENPTWVEDVLPIMRANCFHCHGPTADLHKHNTKRWDVWGYLNITTVDKVLTEGEPTAYSDLGFKLEKIPVGSSEDSTWVSVNDPNHVNLFPAYIGDPSDPMGMVSEDGRMPPPPATRLSDRDTLTIIKWIKNKAPQGKHSPNSKPQISWLEKGKVIEIADADGDIVLGRATCADDMVFQLRYPGAHKLPKGYAPPCTVEAYDGFDKVTKTLQ